MSDRHTISPEYQIQQARKVKRLEAENAQLRAAQTWISVKDRMPDHRKRGWFLTWDGQCMGIERIHWRTGAGDIFFRASTPLVSHWMPLPAAPSAGGDGDR